MAKHRLEDMMAHNEFWIPQVLDYGDRRAARRTACDDSLLLELMLLRDPDGHN